MAEQGAAGRRDRMIHHYMAAVGGFLGAYAFMNRLDTFGSSATANMAHIVMALLGRDWKDFLLRLGAVTVYILGLELSIVLPLLAGRRGKRFSLRRCAVAIDALGMVALYFLPLQMDHLLALYPMLFITAFQWNSFSTADMYNSATIFSTNNLRQCCAGYIRFLFNGDSEQLRRGRFFGITLLCFHLGVAYGWLACRLWNVRGSLAGLPLLIMPQLLLVREGREEQSAVDDPFSAVR